MHRTHMVGTCSPGCSMGSAADPRAMALSRRACTCNIAGTTMNHTSRDCIASARTLQGLALAPDLWPPCCCIGQSLAEHRRIGSGSRRGDGCPDRHAFPSASSGASHGPPGSSRKQGRGCLRSPSEAVPSRGENFQRHLPQRCCNIDIHAPEHSALFVTLVCAKIPSGHSGSLPSDPLWLPAEAWRIPASS